MAGIVHVALGAEDQYTTKITARGHVLTSDEPITEGGLDQGMAPFELVLAGLGSCTAMTLQMYARRKSWPLEKVAVDLAHNKGDVSLGQGSIFTREITLYGALTEEQRLRLLEIANRCPVHRALSENLQIISSLK